MHNLNRTHAFQLKLTNFAQKYLRENLFVLTRKKVEISKSLLFFT